MTEEAFDDGNKGTGALGIGTSPGAEKKNKKQQIKLWYCLAVLGLTRISNGRNGTGTTPPDARVLRSPTVLHQLSDRKANRSSIRVDRARPNNRTSFRMRLPPKYVIVARSCREKALFATPELPERVFHPTPPRHRSVQS